MQWVASQESLVLALSSANFIDLIKSNADFLDWFANLPQTQETAAVAKAATERLLKRDKDWKDSLVDQIKRAVVVSLQPGESFSPPDKTLKGTTWLLSTANISGYPVGCQINVGDILGNSNNFTLPYRLVGMPPASNSTTQYLSNKTSYKSAALGPLNSTSLDELGIVEGDDFGYNDKYPLVLGKGVLNETLAVCEMVALQQGVPFRRDNVKKILEDQFRRDKSLNLELIGALTETLGLRTQLGSVNKEFSGNIECPAILLLEGSPVLLFEISFKKVVYADPRKGFCSDSLTNFQSFLNDQVHFALPRRITSSPSSRFGWSWFTPLLDKYKNHNFVL